MDKSHLIDKTCVPCRGNVPPMTYAASDKLIQEVGDGWSMNSAGHLYKEYSFDDFMQSLTFANKIGDLAEKEGHHPNLMISWGLCVVEIWTHKINGLTESDFILALKIETIR
jgi:4a-hydroxytetrahydrobiopterin dehydratase